VSCFGLPGFEVKLVEASEEERRLGGSRGGEGEVLRLKKKRGVSQNGTRRIENYEVDSRVERLHFLHDDQSSLRPLRRRWRERGGRADESRRESGDEEEIDSLELIVQPALLFELLVRELERFRVLGMLDFDERLSVLERGVAARGTDRGALSATAGRALPS